MTLTRNETIALPSFDPLFIKSPFRIQFITSLLSGKAKVFHVVKISLKKVLDGFNQPLILFALSEGKLMSNMPAVDKRKVSLQLPIKTIVKMDKICNSSGLSRNEVASVLLDKGTSHVELDEDDMRIISDEIRSNREKRIRG